MFSPKPSLCRQAQRSLSAAAAAHRAEAFASQAWRACDGQLESGVRHRITRQAVSRRSNSTHREQLPPRILPGNPPQDLAHSRATSNLCASRIRASVFWFLHMSPLQLDSLCVLICLASPGELRIFRRFGLQCDNQGRVRAECVPVVDVAA